ncbi:heme ABC exporter ATP-binding protein CcmA [Caldilinea sp.]|uniref:heme ABC exporter ATP-binding protein CcmA n=1 Tax=Caldilinea sp. TaxID=2293560 RepID=UPI0026372BEB|nr:heme ABC exporter ATP-binding protein CcmA [uncultured Caldilinea sp.]
MNESGLIVARNIVKRYGRKRVLNGVEMCVPQGQVMALLGPNGAGKSTLLRIISGLAKPDRGEILLGGVSTRKAGHEIRRYIGLVAHAPLLYDNLSAWDNLHFFARLYDIQQPAARVEAVLRAVDLWTRRHDPVRTYSRGMTQRLAIGRAILHDPPVLLLDEPDTGLDPSSAETLAQLIRMLSSGRRAILLTTHNLERAIAWADSISLLADGKIIWSTATEGLTSEKLRQAMTELEV